VSPVPVGKSMATFMTRPGQRSASVAPVREMPRETRTCRPRDGPERGQTHARTVPVPLR